MRNSWHRKATTIGLITVGRDSSGAKQTLKKSRSIGMRGRQCVSSVCFASASVCWWPGRCVAEWAVVSRWVNQLFSWRAVCHLSLYPQFYNQTMVLQYEWVVVEKLKWQSGGGGWTAMGSLAPDKIVDNKEEGKRQWQRRWTKRKKKISKHWMNI